MVLGHGPYKYIATADSAESESDETERYLNCALSVITLTDNANDIYICRCLCNCILNDINDQ